MRISDWSSDVCSSDLVEFALGFFGLPVGIVDEDDDGLPLHVEPGIVVPALFGRVDAVTDKDDVAVLDLGPRLNAIAERDRSAERRGGKECVSKCRYRWSPYH